MKGSLLLFLAVVLQASASFCQMAPAIAGNQAAQGPERLTTVSANVLEPPLPIISAASPAHIGVLHQDEAKRQKPVSMRRIYALALMQHSAAIFDAWSTRRVLNRGGMELNPMLKPFAHSATLYPALQAWPSGMDYLGYRMSRSNRRLFQRTWWIPQVASTAVFVTFAAHNAAIAH